MTAARRVGADGRREPGIWQQFRRRRVTRTVLLYLAFAFLSVEVVLTLAGYVALPPWALRAVFGAAVLGFPFAVVLAWTYDVTPSGIVRTPEVLAPEVLAHEAPAATRSRRTWLLVAAAVVAGLVLRSLRA